MIISDNLRFSYASLEDDAPLRPAIDGVCFSIGKGEFVAVVGRNGSGKSTLARHINALLSPTEGTMRVNGIDTKDETQIWEIRRIAGMVFQNPDNQIVASTVEEDTAFGPENMGVPSHEIRSRVDTALAAVDMLEHVKSAPHHLSGGQKQRVAIAGVLAMQPSIIIFDESTAMLDPSGRREVMRTIKDLHQKGHTIILITHFMEEAAQAERIIVMDHGRVALDGPPRDIFTRSDILTNIGLTVPQAVLLAQGLRETGLTVSNVLTAEELITEKSVIETAERFTYFDKLATVKTLLPLPQTDPLIKIHNLTHIYNPGAAYEKKAISDINLTIHKGEIIGIIGHTGSGKSTLIQHLNALLKPTSGQIIIDGEDIHADKKNLKNLRKRVGLVFQYPEHQLFESTVYKDVAFGPIHTGMPADKVDESVRRSLKIVGLSEETFEKSPFTLSGGQKRRAAIAGVLAMQPDILILDEPTAGLDPSGREEILAQIKKMHAELNVTVIIISHSMDDAARLCGRIIVMNQGQIALDGTPAEIFSQGPALEDFGLDVPHVTRIMAYLARINPVIPAGILTVEEAVRVLSASPVSKAFPSEASV
ncbi:MAG: energy-coupling factor transporter ATPase [Defluviitaleaceae bacterium]|nr:energy-coupling factor transporter ATPase [Defluviitaleaceae bacterium]